MKNIFPPPPPLPCKGQEIGCKSSKKWKWKPVGPPDFRFNLTQHRNRAAFDITSDIDWNNIMGVFRSSSGCQGVYFTKLSCDTVLVLKACTIEEFIYQSVATNLAQYLFISSPDLRFVHKSDPEFRSIRSGMRNLYARHSASSFFSSSAVASLFGASHIAVMELAVGTELGETKRKLSSEDWRALGRVLALDLALNNTDRFPGHLMWRRGWRPVREQGNAGNILLGRSAGHVVAIDHVLPIEARRPGTALLDNYVERQAQVVQGVVAWTLVRRRGAGRTTTATMHCESSGSSSSTYPHRGQDTTRGGGQIDLREGGDPSSQSEGQEEERRKEEEEDSGGGVEVGLQALKKVRDFVLAARACGGEPDSEEARSATTEDDELESMGRGFLEAVSRAAEFCERDLLRMLDSLQQQEEDGDELSPCPEDSLVLEESKSVSTPPVATMSTAAARRRPTTGVSTLKVVAAYLRTTMQPFVSARDWVSMWQDHRRRRLVGLLRWPRRVATKTTAKWFLGRGQREPVVGEPSLSVLLDITEEAGRPEPGVSLRFHLHHFVGLKKQNRSHPRTHQSEQGRDCSEDRGSVEVTQTAGCVCCNDEDPPQRPSFLVLELDHREEEHANSSITNTTTNNNNKNNRRCRGVHRDCTGRGGTKDKLEQHGAVSLTAPGTSAEWRQLQGHWWEDVFLLDDSRSPRTSRSHKKKTEESGRPRRNRLGARHVGRLVSMLEEKGFY